MFKIEDNYITVVKGDTGVINVEIDGYDLVFGDIIKFSVKESMDSSIYTLNKIIDNFEDGKAKIVLTSDDTNLDIGKYVYDIQANLSDGRVDTLIINKFKVIGGVTD